LSFIVKLSNSTLHGLNRIIVISIYYVTDTFATHKDVAITTWLKHVASYIP